MVIDEEMVGGNEIIDTAMFGGTAGDSATKIDGTDL